MNGHGTLNAKRFAGAYQLWKGGKTEGEREAARLAGVRVAASAGISFEEACRRHERARPAPDRGAEAREEASRQAEAAREEARREREAEALRKYGSREAVFSVCEREAALLAACDQFARREVDYDPAHPDRVSNLDGWEGYTLAEMPHAVRVAVKAAFPMPSTLSEAWDEVRYWRKRLEPRFAFEFDYSPPLAVSARELLIGRYLYDWPAMTLEEAALRCDWFQAEVRERDFSFQDGEEEQFARAVKRDLVDVATLHARIAADAATVRYGQTEASPPEDRPSAAAGVQNGHSEPAAPEGYSARRTTAQRREAVFELLRSAEGVSLSDREIARRAGVSPQTVGNLRRRAT